MSRSIFYIISQNKVVLSSLLVFLFQINIAISQISVIGNIVSKDNKPIEFASISLFRRDSVFISGTIANQNGGFNIINIPIGQYFIKCSAVGYVTFVSDTLFFNQPIVYNLTAFHLEEQENLLDAVTVKSMKLQVKNDIDKTVINLGEQNSSASLSILDILKKTPNIAINETNNEISIDGKNSVAVAINNREIKMPQEALMQFLSSINSKDILSIELISNPSAEYGGGVSAILNIILKKRTEKGIGGNIFLGGGYGVDRKIDFGGSINMVHKKSTLLISFNNNLNNTKETYTFDRSFDFINKISRINTISSRTPTVNTQSSSLLFETELLSNNIGVSLIGQRRVWEMIAQNNIQVYRKDSISNLTNIDNEIDKWNNMLSNLHINRKKNKYALDLSIDYLFYKNDNNHVYKNSDSKNPTFIQNSNSDKSTPIKIFVSSLNYTRLNNKLNYSYSIGAKFSNSFLRNDVIVNDEKNGIFQSNTDFTQNVSRQEKNYAVFGAIKYKTNSFDFSAGLRYELFDADLYDYIQQKSILETNNKNLLPDFKIATNNKNYEIAFLYNMRVDRPKFQDLSPFVVFLGPYTYYNGNININSSVINNFKISYLKNLDNFSIQCSIVKNPIYQFQPTISKGNIEVITPLNFDKAIVADIFYSKSLKYKNFEVDMFGSLKYQHLQNYISSNIIEYKKVSTKISVNLSYITKTGISFNISSYYQSPYYSGMVLRTAPGQTDFLIKKKLFTKGTLSFSASDIFRTNIWTFDPNWNQISSTVETNYIYAETRVFKLSLSIDFGGKIKTDANTNSSEERKRME